MINLKFREDVIQNLKDAGCNPHTIKNFLLYFEQDQKEEQLALLETYRKQLLNKVHKEEEKIYCVDYLIYQIEK